MCSCTSNKFHSIRWSYSCINILDMIRERHADANSVILKVLKLIRNTDVSYEDIYVDALYIGRVPTTDDPEGSGFI